MPHVLLLVDDEANVRLSLRRVLRGEPYEILEATSGEEALLTLSQRQVDVIITDQCMHGMSGVELVRRAYIAQPDAIRIILTGHADLGMAVRALNEKHVYRFLLKPWEGIDVKVMLRLAVRHLESERRNARLLRLLRRQASLLERLEREHPEILAVERDEGGRIVLSEEDLGAAMTAIAGEIIFSEEEMGGLL